MTRESIIASVKRNLPSGTLAKISEAVESDVIAAALRSRLAAR